MKDIDIHNGLPQQEIRDFLSQSILKTYVRERQNKKVEIPYIKEDTWQWSILDTEAQIAERQEYLKILKERQAIVLLIKNNGWQEYDVSDYVEASYSNESWMNFIGTEAEYKGFMKNFEI